MFFNLATAFERPKLTETEYVGKVLDNNDPEKMGRCKISIPDVFGTRIDTKNLPWCAPLNSFIEGASTEIGAFSVPLVGAEVLVDFSKGDIYSPRYRGQLRAKTQLITEMETNYPDRFGKKDSSGNLFYADRKEGTIDVHHHSGTVIHIANDGSVTCTVVKDQSLTVKENATVLVEKSCSVTVKENNTVAIEGDNAITVNGNTTLQTDGNVDSTVGGNLTANVSGKGTIDVGGICDIKTGSMNASVNGQLNVSTSAQAKISVNGQCELSVSGPLNISASAQIEIVTTGICKIQASKVNLAAGVLELGQGASEPVVLGNKLAQFIMTELTPWLSSHVHTGNKGSPTSPPLVPFVAGSAVPGGPIYSKKTYTQP